MLDLLSDNWLGGVILHPSVHEIQFLDMHGILAQLRQIAMPQIAGT